MMLVVRSWSDTCFFTLNPLLIGGSSSFIGTLSIFRTSSLRICGIF